MVCIHPPVRYVYEAVDLCSNPLLSCKYMLFIQRTVVRDTADAAWVIGSSQLCVTPILQGRMELYLSAQDLRRCDDRALCIVNQTSFEVN
jgi:hypothetical protein